VIRRATESDYQAIEDLSQAIWKDDDKLTNRPAGWNRRRWTVKNHTVANNKPGQTTRVKEVDGGVVAAGTIVFREQEPRNDIYLHIAPEFRGRGISEELFESLDAAHNAGPYTTREFGDPEAVAMFEALGFQAVERVTEGWIHPAEAATAAWIDGVLAAPRDDLSIIPLGERGSPAPVEVARLYDRAYQRAHFYLPDTPRSDTEALDFFFGTAFFSSPAIATFCAVAGGRLVGGGSLSPPAFGEDDPGSAHLAWVWFEPPDLADADVVVEVLVAHVLDAARRKGLRVQAEVCSIVPLVKACVRSIPGTDLEEGLTVLISDPVWAGLVAL
jgi:GNAT superfamily N-acetyltransferase